MDHKVENCENLNPIEVSLDSNSLINELLKYKKYKYRFIIANLLSSSSIKNDTQVIFTSCDELKNAKEAFINSKLYKTLGVVYLNKKNWNLIKRHSKEFEKWRAIGASVSGVGGVLTWVTWLTC